MLYGDLENSDSKISVLRREDLAAKSSMDERPDRHRIGTTMH